MSPVPSAGVAVCATMLTAEPTSSAPEASARNAILHLLIMRSVIVQPFLRHLVQQADFVIANVVRLSMFFRGPGPTIDGDA